MAKYFFSKKPTPVLNTNTFRKVFGGKDGTSLQMDKKGHVRAFEFVALINTRFLILKRHGNHIFQVKTDEYPISPLYVDERFLSPYPQITRAKPTKTEIINNLKSLIGKPYIWGGNWSRGIYDLINYYPPSIQLDKKTFDTWTLSGVDCSGLLFEATNGFTPRNTKELMRFGSNITFNIHSLPSIIKTFNPLDLIIFPGHVIIALDNYYTIESLEGEGVILTPISKRIKLILQNNNENLPFFIRRWIK